MLSKWALNVGEIFQLSKLSCIGMWDRRNYVFVKFVQIYVRLVLQTYISEAGKLLSQSADGISWAYRWNVQSMEAKNQNDMGSRLRLMLQIIYLKHQRQEAGDKTQQNWKQVFCEQVDLPCSNSPAVQKVRPCLPQGLLVGSRQRIGRPRTKQGFQEPPKLQCRWRQPASSQPHHIVTCGKSHGPDVKAQWKRDAKREG